MAARETEAWLRGPIGGVHPLVMPVVASFTMVREDLAVHTSGLSPAEVWRPVSGSSLGFHLRHIAGSVDRLTTYLFSEQLTTSQFEFLHSERDGIEPIDVLLDKVNLALEHAERRLREVNPESIYEQRFVGRQALPTTVIGLLVHLCEHTQRHLGQAIILAKTLRESHDV